MFTGIVHSTGEITSIARTGESAEFEISVATEVCQGLAVGASVAIDGVCLTAREVTNNTIHFDAMGETLNITTLGDIAVGDLVNVERSLIAGSEVGGHIVSGHVDTTATVTEIEETTENYVVTFSVEPRWAWYIFTKGFIALNGISLTIVDADRKAGTFRVWLIPETLERTNIGRRGKGQRVNVEIDRSTQVIVDTVIDLFAGDRPLPDGKNPSKPGTIPAPLADLREKRSANE